jgi:hypothetical protein
MKVNPGVGVGHDHLIDGVPTDEQVFAVSQVELNVGTRQTGSYEPRITIKGEFAQTRETTQKGDNRENMENGVGCIFDFDPDLAA